MTERGRDTAVDEKKTRARSRSRIRRVKNGEEKPIGSRLKKLVKGIGRKSSKSLSDSASVSSSQAPSAEVIAKSSTKKRPEPIEQSPSPSLQLVLLLLDPSSRRFELLQLEFDSLRARVVDIIAQIPVSVTEEAIRTLQFEGVIGEDQELKDSSARLAEFCKEKQVLVALPKDLSVKECIRLARPILNDGEVLKMVRCWLQHKGLHGALLTLFQLSRSGFDVSSWKKKEAPPAAPSAPASETATRVLPAVDESIQIQSSRKEKEGANAFPVIALLAIFAIVVQAVNKFVSMPIQVGVPLRSGAKRSKCGLLGYIPPKIAENLPISCENSFLEVGKDGTVSVFDDSGETVMLMIGDVCTSESCVEGLIMERDGSVFVGGKKVKTMLVYGGKKDVTPWPFEHTPKLKFKKNSLYK